MGKASDGEFDLGPVSFDDRVVATSSAVSRSGNRDDWPVESGVYHLVGARACPFAHRAIIARRLLGLESAVSLGMCGPTHDWKSWTFNLYPDSVDPVLGVGRLRDCYLRRRSPSCGHLRGRSSRPETHCGRGGHGSAHERQEPNHEQEDPLRRFSPRRRRGEHRTALSAPWRSHPTHELFT